MISLVYFLSSTCCASNKYHKYDWSYSHIFTKTILGYNHLQPPEMADFSMVEMIINILVYFNTKNPHTFLEV